MFCLLDFTGFMKTATKTFQQSIMQCGYGVSLWCFVYIYSYLHNLLFVLEKTTLLMLGLIAISSYASICLMGRWCGAPFWEVELKQLQPSLKSTDWFLLVINCVIITPAYYLMLQFLLIDELFAIITQATHASL